MFRVSVQCLHKHETVYPEGMTQPHHSDPSTEIDLNQVVAYNVREARLLRGWTQEDLADQLESYLGQRLTQAGISSIERAWDGERRREFDAHELLIFAMVFNLPILYFLLPPPGDQRRLQGTSEKVNDLYGWLLGREGQFEPLYERLRQLGITDPTATDEAAEKLLGITSDSRKASFKERRKEMLVALLDRHADNFDRDIEELGRIIDHLRQAGLRGYVAEKTFDEDFTYPGSQPPDIPAQTWAVENQTASDETSQDEGSSGDTA